ncbi:MAG TPA: NUDIX hydrolase [Nocardioidaceae bacterium]|nr:NUDIX hydrolase [Nocardioidaceae bacterium]
MDPTRRLPADLAARARAYAGGDGVPAQPRDASTVVLLRAGDGEPGGLQVYLLRRHVDMAFAAGRCVFPGGGVDHRDFDAEIGWEGPAPARWAALLGTDEALARALVCAAVRETFEESGVLLAGPTSSSVVADTTGEDWEADRRALESRDLPFTEFLASRGLLLRTDLLRLWGSWVTPVFEPRRFDTRFFVAELPPGQATRDVSTESDSVDWVPVREAIRAVDAGRMLMLPPTYCTCLELFDFVQPPDVLAAALDREPTVVEPEAQVRPDGAYLHIPDRLVALSRDVAARLPA